MFLIKAKMESGENPEQILSTVMWSCFNNHCESEKVKSAMKLSQETCMNLKRRRIGGIFE